jgi:hypothetical protein
VLSVIDLGQARLYLFKIGFENSIQALWGENVKTNEKEPTSFFTLSKKEQFYFIYNFNFYIPLNFPVTSTNQMVLQLKYNKWL